MTQGAKGSDPSSRRAGTRGLTPLPLASSAAKFVPAGLLMHNSGIVRGRPMIVLNDFAGQNWLITPAALAFGEQPPASIHDQRFLLVLSGVVIANLEGISNSQWLHQ